MGITIIITLAILGVFVLFLFLSKKSKKMDTSNQNLLDEKIKAKFKLFQGVRSQDEDQKILEKIQELCFKEMLYFIAQNLSDDDRSAFEKEAEKAGEDAKSKVFTDYLVKIPNYKEQLNQRIDKYLDKIIETSLKSQTK